MDTTSDELDELIARVELSHRADDLPARFSRVTTAETARSSLTSFAARRRLALLDSFPRTPSFAWTPFEIDRGASQLDLSMSIDPTISRRVYLEFNTDLFDRATMEQWLFHYRTLLESLVEGPDLPVSRLRLLSERDEEARRATMWHYQWVLLYDYLPGLVGPELAEPLGERRAVHLRHDEVGEHQLEDARQTAWQAGRGGGSPRIAGGQPHAAKLAIDDRAVNVRS